MFANQIFPPHSLSCMSASLLDPKSIRRISYIVEFLLIFNFTEFFVGLLIYAWGFDLRDRGTSSPSDWLGFTGALAKQDLPITARLLILLGATGFVIIGGIGLSLYFGYQRSRWIGCFFGVILGGTAFFVGRRLVRLDLPLYSVVVFFVIQSFSVIILNIFVSQLSLFTNLPSIRIFLKSCIIAGNQCIQILFPLLLATDESGFGPKLALILGYILSIGCYSLGRYLSVYSAYLAEQIASENNDSRVNLLLGSKDEENGSASASDNEN